MLGVHTQLLHVRSMVQLVRWSIEQQLALIVCTAHTILWQCMQVPGSHVSLPTQWPIVRLRCANGAPPTGARVAPQHSSAGRKSTARTMSGKY